MLLRVTLVLSAVGLLAGMMAATELTGEDWTPPPATSAMGALLAHITGDAEASDYQPMNIMIALIAAVVGIVVAAAVVIIFVLLVIIER